MVLGMGVHAMNTIVAADFRVKMFYSKRSLFNVVYGRKSGALAQPTPGRYSQTVLRQNGCCGHALAAGCRYKNLSLERPAHCQNRTFRECPTLFYFARSLVGTDK
jgi:hypothetical protein